MKFYSFYVLFSEMTNNFHLLSLRLNNKLEDVDYLWYCTFACLNVTTQSKSNSNLLVLEERKYYSHYGLVLIE